MAGLGSVLITLSAWLLEVVGLLFNYLLHYTVIAFGDATNGFLTQGVLDGINATWTVFRDIANILIIGLFTFIAISTILGNHEFGAKKMLAKALIIAVLINFSLLFTKMIIDVSNFTAYQFYGAASNLKPIGSGLGNADSKAISNASTLSFTQDGIAGQFIKYLGVTSFTDTFGKLNAGAESADNGWLALLHGVFGATMLLATALVLLYGSFLLVSRAILIVFLLITSSLAFAAYLLPKSLQGSYGWSTWWDSLIKTAVFAPLLMMFLWATLQLASSLNRGREGTLGKLMTDPTNASNLSALFGYIIILGLLFASFKISSSFASKIAGFNLAAMIPAIGLAAGARVAAFAGRQTIGRGSYAMGKALQTRAQGAKEGSMAQSLYKFGSNRFMGVAKSDMNAMRTSLGGALGKTAGIDAKALAGAEIKGFEGSFNARAKKFAAEAEKLHVDAKDQAKITAKAVEKEIANSPALQTRHTDAKQAMAMHTDDKADAERQLAIAQETRAKAEVELRRASQAGDNAAASSAQHAIDDSARNFREQTERIKQATERLKDATDVVDNIESEAARSAISKGNLKVYSSESDIAAKLAHNRFSNTLARATGWNTEANDRLAKLARKEVGEHHERKEAKKIVEYLKEKTGEGGHGAPAATPAATHTTPAHIEEPHTPPPATGGVDAHGDRH